MSLEKPEQSSQEDKEIPVIPKFASDMELVDFLIRNIQNPFELETGDGQSESSRSLYIKEAERHLPDMTNPFAKEMLEAEIDKYKQ